MERKIFCVFFFDSENDIFPLSEFYFTKEGRSILFWIIFWSKKELTRMLLNTNCAYRHFRMTRVSENRDSFNKKLDSEFDLKAAAKMSNKCCLKLRLKLNEAFFKMSLNCFQELLVRVNLSHHNQEKGQLNEPAWNFDLSFWLNHCRPQLRCSMSLIGRNNSETFAHVFSPSCSSVM